MFSNESLSEEAVVIGDLFFGDFESEEGEAVKSEAAGRSRMLGVFVPI